MLGKHLSGRNGRKDEEGDEDEDEDEEGEEDEEGKRMPKWWRSRVGAYE